MRCSGGLQFPESPQPVKVLLVEDNPGDVRLISRIARRIPRPIPVDVPGHPARGGGGGRRERRGGPRAAGPEPAGQPGVRDLRSACSPMGATCPILVLSGVDDESLALRMVHAGAQDYLVKGQVRRGSCSARAMRYAIERNSAEQELAQERNLVRALLETMPDRIYFKDRESRFVRVNPAMARFSSSSAPRTRSARRTSISSCRSTRRRPLRMNRRSSGPGSRWWARWRRRHCRMGSIGWALTTKMPLRDQAGAHHRHDGDVPRHHAHQADRG